MFKKKHNIHQQELEFALSLLQAHMGPTAIINALKNEGLDDESAIWLFNQARMQKASQVAPDAMQYQTIARRVAFQSILVGAVLTLPAVVFFYYAMLPPLTIGDSEQSIYQSRVIFLLVLFIASCPLSVGVVNLLMSFFPPRIGFLELQADVPQRETGRRMFLNYGTVIVSNLALSVLFIELATDISSDASWLSLGMTLFAVSRLWTLRLIVPAYRSLRIALGFKSELVGDAYYSPYNWQIYWNGPPRVRSSISNWHGIWSGRTTKW